MPVLPERTVNACNTRMELFLFFMKNNSNQIKEKIFKLSKELRKLEIEYEHATRNDLPGWFPVGESDGIIKRNKYIENLDEYKSYLFGRIKYYKKNIELLELDLDSSTKKMIHKNVWKGSKSEFAQFIVNQYQKEKKEFPSLRKAVEYYYNVYKGDIFQNWNVENCYSLARQK